MYFALNMLSLVSQTSLVRMILIFVILASFDFVCTIFEEKIFISSRAFVQTPEIHQDHSEYWGI